MGKFTNFMNRFRKSHGLATQLLDSDDRAFFTLKHSCPSCKLHIDTAELATSMYVCPKCQYHFRLNAHERLKMLFDADNSIEELFSDVQPRNPIGFPGYEEKVRSSTEKSGLREAVSVAVGRVDGRKIVAASMSFQFMGGSMGSVVGEKVTRAILYALEEKIPCLICTASGGARMQEGIFSLLQMAKTSHAIALLQKTQIPVFILISDPTTGGVTASFTMLGDVILAEPRALIGFAGPRVIEGTIKQKLPPNFQRSEFLLEHGFVDAVVPRDALRTTIAHLVDAHSSRLRKTTPIIADTAVAIEREVVSAAKERSAWDSVQLARHIERPTALEYIDLMSDEVVELHGDRLYGDDPAIVAGLCKIANVWFTFVGQQKGKNMKENIYRNYGMPHPEGYRKALRIVRQAEKFGRPVLSLIDTPGAYPGIAAEERGISESIAKSIFEFSTLRTPVISVIIGEGGSGGALGIAVSDALYMLEHAVYSVITAEGCASILLRDSSRASEAAELLKMTSSDLLSFGLIEGIIPEPEGGAHVDRERCARRVKTAVLSTYEQLSRKKIDQLLRERSEKILSFGLFGDKEERSNSILQRFLRMTKFQE